MRAFLLASIVGVVSACGGSVEPEAEQSVDSSSTTTTDSDTTVTDSTIGMTSDGETPIADAETPTTDGSMPTTDSGGTGTIKCGTETCNGATQECCVGFSGSKCVAKGGCGGGSTFTCSDTASCPSGQVCCAERTSSGGGGASCKTTCSMGVVLCSKDSECKMGERCVAGLGGFKFCRATMGGGFDGGFGGFDGGFGGFDASGFDTKFGG